MLIAAAWDQLHRAQQAGTLATRGPYAVIRHPQYLGFIGILVGFLVQWPTVLTLLMFPVLVVMYVRLARREEQEALAIFGELYHRYMTTTPGWIPRLPGRQLAGPHRG